MSAIEKHWVELTGKEIMLENKHVQCFPHYLIDYLIYLHKPITKKKNVFSTSDNFRRKSKTTISGTGFCYFILLCISTKRKKKLLEQRKDFCLSVCHYSSVERLSGIV